MDDNVDENEEQVTLTRTVIGCGSVTSGDGVRCRRTSTQVSRAL